jgi:glutaminase
MSIEDVIELPVASFLSSLHDRFSSLTSGANASYIPPLAEADPSWFGIVLATADGHLYEVGETRRSFTIQSMSKAFTFGMALQDRGADVVLKHVGVEPTGDPFNSISVEEDTKRPFNPMVNAGAIVTTSLLSGATPADQWERLISGLSLFAGRDLDVDERIFNAERETGDRNRAIAYFMRALDMGSADVDGSLDLYFRQCSVLVDCRDLGVMAATLANRGVNPMTGKRALEEDEVVRVLSVMSTCGMYDFTGEWVYRVGIPAKSGVSGGIIAVVPGQLGIGVYSPPLDKRGNSVRGVAICEQLSQRFSLNLNRTHLRGSSIVRRQYLGSVVRSKRFRDERAAAALSETGAAITVFELQGDLFFATAEALSRTVAFGSGDVRFLILDCRRIGHVDGGALEVFAEMVELAKQHGVQILLAEAVVFESSIEVPDSIAMLRSFEDVDRALEWCEDEVIASTLPNEPGGEAGPAAPGFLDELSPSMLQELEAHTELLTFPAGTAIFSEGDASDGMFFIVSGRVSVYLSGRVQSRRLASFGPGAEFGEMAFLDNGNRSGAIVADVETTCRFLSKDALGSLASGRFPEITTVLYKNLAKRLAQRLREANDAMRSLE